MGLNDASMSTQAAVDIDRPTNVVWEHVQDLTHLGEFSPQLKWVKLVEGQHGSVGAVYEQYTKAGMAGAKSRFEVISVEPGMSITWQQQTGNTNSQVRMQAPVTSYRLAPSGDGTHLELESNVAMSANRMETGIFSPGMLLQKLALKIFGGSADRRAAGYLEDVKAWIESQPPQQQTGS